MSNLQNILVTAIACIVIVYVVCRRFPGRRRDLRSEVHAEQESLRAAAESLPATLHMAKRTRAAAAEEAGQSGSEEWQRFVSEWDADWLEANQLALQVLAADTDYGALSDMELDVRLLEIFALALRAHSLIDKYQALPAAAGGDYRESRSDTLTSERSLPGAIATRDRAIELIQPRPSNA
jgi:hypothetical protein